MMTLQALMVKNRTDLDVIDCKRDDDITIAKSKKCYGQGLRAGAFNYGGGIGETYFDYFLEYKTGRGIGETSAPKELVQMHYDL